MSDAVYISKLTGPEIDAALEKAAQALPMSGGKLTGPLDVGDKVRIWSDGEGGNIRLYSPDGATTDFWEIDPCDGDDLRIFAYKNATNPNGEGYAFSLHIYSDGSIGCPNAAKTRERLGAAPEDVYKFLTLGATSSYGKWITDALNINLIDPLGDENRPGYVYSGGTTALPDGFSNGIRETFYYSPEWIIVKLTGFDTLGFHPCVVYNVYRGSSVGWTGWEWENPPMAVDIEYCTTERWFGKKVYTKLLSFGALPNNSTKTVAVCTDSTASGKIISAEGLDLTTNQRIPTRAHDNWMGGETAINFTSHYNVTIATNYDGSGCNAVVTVKYTKD